MSSNYIVGGIASGKTTKALKWLDEQGGGTFITRYPEEIRILVQRVELKNPQSIRILDVSNTHIVVDDADDVNTAVVMRSNKMS